jgi:indole-3-glycerol phosphate synthase
MNLLDRILAEKRESLAERMAARPLNEIRAMIRGADAPRGFHRALVEATAPVSLIAEVKPGSPTRAVIRPNLDPVAVAQAYEQAGAHCLSVLTDVKHFGGSEANLRAARAAVSLPVLRKDFVVDAYDVEEARAMGADAVLLIVNGLSDGALREYRELAESLGMDALVEVHSPAEAERAVASGAKLIGVNNRDLESFQTSVEVGLAVLPGLLGKATLVSESALTNQADVNRVAAAGARSVLIGTAFCESSDIEARVREVMGWPRS